MNENILDLVVYVMDETLYFKTVIYGKRWWWTFNPADVDLLTLIEYRKKILLLVAQSLTIGFNRRNHVFPIFFDLPLHHKQQEMLLSNYEINKL